MCRGGSVAGVPGNGQIRKSDIRVLFNKVVHCPFPGKQDYRLILSVRSEDGTRGKSSLGESIEIC